MAGWSSCHAYLEYKKTRLDRPTISVFRKWKHTEGIYYNFAEFVGSALLKQMRDKLHTAHATMPRGLRLQ